MSEHAAEATMAATANKVTYGGSGIAFIGGLAASDIAAFGGLLMAGIGVAVQWYYKRRADRREAELHQARLRDLKE